MEEQPAERPSIEERIETQRQLARNLTDYKGLWVGVNGADVVAAAESPRGVMEQVREEELEVERMFRVPKKRRTMRLGKLALQS